MVQTEFEQAVIIKSKGWANSYRAMLSYSYAPKCSYIKFSYAGIHCGKRR